MPLIACPDCNKEISDAAPACPNCGRAISPPSVTPTERQVSIPLGIGILLVPLVFAWFTLRKGYSAKAKVISFAWLLFSLAIFAAQDGGKKSATAGNVSQSSSKAAPANPAMQVGIRQLLGDYEDNEVAADNRYKGNRVEVTGIVGDIKKDMMDNLYVTLGTGRKFEIPQIQAFFDDSMNNQLGNLRQGQKLTVVCTIKGLMMNVLGEDCIIRI